MEESASSPPVLIRLKGVTKVYGSGKAKVRALDGIDLSVNEGDFVAIMGPSGSGKSTAMNIIGCLDVPTEGEYLFMGVNVKALTRNQRALLRRNFLGFRLPRLQPARPDVCGRERGVAVDLSRHGPR